MEKLNRTNRKLINKGHIIDYYNDTILINNNEHIYDFIEHKGAAAMIPIDEEGNILMIKQYRNAIDRFTLEIPAGGKELGEDPIDCAIRECEEETGYKPIEAHHLIDLYTSIAFCNEKIYIYYSNKLVKTKQNLDDGEFVQVESYSLEKLIDLIIEGKIKDSKTISAILAYKQIIDK
ncbi:MAG TPA: NUDIX hydrolase [Clostridiales bacterium]|nr:NUDIX hydrolase [Clostridiales bacterium]